MSRRTVQIFQDNTLHVAVIQRPAAALSPIAVPYACLCA